MQFEHTAKSGHGKSPTGVLEADSPTEAKKQLRDQGLDPVSVKKENGRKRNTGSSKAKLSILGPRVARIDLLTVTSQLAIMCQSGIDLAEALQNIGDQCEKPVLKSALQNVFAAVSDGESVSAAMRKQPHVFDDAYVASVAAGEASGQLPEVLSRQTTLLQNEIKLRSTIRTALSYPMVLTFVSSLVLFALLFFVLPQFSKWTFRHRFSPKSFWTFPQACGVIGGCGGDCSLPLLRGGFDCGEQRLHVDIGMGYS